MGWFKNLIIRLAFRWELQPKSFNHLNLSELFSLHSRALPGSPQEARMRAELCNREGTLDEWIAIYSRSFTESWVEDLSFRNIRKASATYDKWFKIFLSFPAGSPIRKIAKQKMDSPSRS